MKARIFFTLLLGILCLSNVAQAQATEPASGSTDVMLLYIGLIGLGFLAIIFVTIWAFRKVGRRRQHLLPDYEDQSLFL